MKKIKTPGILAILFMLFCLPLFTMGQATIDIQVAPNVLNLQNQGQVVTVHTDIPYSQVVGSSVSMNDIEIESWKSDNQGYFVAKFNMDAIQGLPLNIDEYNTLTLEGTKTDGTTFTGEDDILVIDRKGNR
jgi:hypothetical protein